LTFKRGRCRNLALLGIWKANGYGWLLQIRSDGYALYDHTDISCVEFERGNSEQFRQGFDRIEVDGDRLSLHVAGDITRYSFNRVQQFHAPIVTFDDARVSDPQFNFEVFWKTFQQDYAFFERHRVDWLAIYQANRHRVGADTTSNELAQVFQDMLEPLQDNHVYLQTDRTHFISDKIADIKRWMVDAFDLETPSLGDADTITQLQSFVDIEILNGAGRTAGNKLITWGFVAPDIAYLSVLRLFGFADTAAARAATGLPKTRYDFARFLADDLAALNDILDAAMAELAGAHALIMDIRINGGGFDKAGITIANRFADRRRAAFSKRARDGQGHTPLQQLFVEPAGKTQFTRPVYLLTAQRTASAGEILTLCMMTLPHVTRVGQPTLGIFSDDLAKHLPNGWVTSLSNEIYASPDGSLYEGDGIPPQIATPVFSEADFKGRLKLAVDTATALAQRN
jgi:carboxyl-terminal processing protease